MKYNSQHANFLSLFQRLIFIVVFILVICLF